MYFWVFGIRCMNLRILCTLFFYPMKGADALEEIVTPSGTITIVHQITLGDIAIVTVVSLVLIFLVLRWLLDNIWRGGK
jgi:hypothetical protein